MCNHFGPSVKPVFKGEQVKCLSPASESLPEQTSAFRSEKPCSFESSVWSLCRHLGSSVKHLGAAQGAQCSSALRQEHDAPKGTQVHQGCRWQSQGQVHFMEPSNPQWEGAWTLHGELLENLSIKQERRLHREHVVKAPLHPLPLNPPHPERSPPFLGTSIASRRCDLP